MGAAWERHAMCESAFTVTQEVNTFSEFIYSSQKYAHMIFTAVINRSSTTTHITRAYRCISGFDKRVACIIIGALREDG